MDPTTGNCLNQAFSIAYPPCFRNQLTNRKYPCGKYKCSPFLIKKNIVDIYFVKVDFYYLCKKHIYFKLGNMIAEPTEKLNRRHIGRNMQRVRMYFGVKQEALAADLGISQQEVSKIEQQDEIEEGMLSRIADVLGVSSEIIRDFDTERVIYNINNSYNDATISEGGTAVVLQINPIEKIVELYERLLKSEREKVDLLKK